MGEVGIDSRYVLLDHPAEFTLKKKRSWSQRDWSISDGAGNLIFQTESRYMESHQRTRLLDGTGNPVVCFEKKRHSQSGTWNVVSGSSEVVLFSLKDSQMFRTKTFMDVFLPSNSDTKNPDYKIRCPERFSSTFSILHGTKEVAVVKRVTKWFGSTTLKVTVYPGTNHVFILTLVIIAEFVRESVAASRSSLAASSAAASSAASRESRRASAAASSAAASSAASAGGGF